jgi:hypothetical protein
LQPKLPSGQEKGEERIGNTVKPFDEPGGDFRCNPKGRGPFGRWRRCSSLIGQITSLLPPSQRPKYPASRPRK